MTSPYFSRTSTTGSIEIVLVTHSLFTTMGPGSSGLSLGPKLVVGSIALPTSFHRASLQEVWQPGLKATLSLSPYSQPPVRNIFITLSSGSIIDSLYHTDTATYATIELGVLRAGFTIFPISPRNSPEAVAHLLKKTGSSHLLVGGEPKFRNLAATSLELLRADGHPEIHFCDMPHFGDLYPHDDSDKQFEDYPAVRFDPDAPSLILHSSGQCSVGLCHAIN